MPRGKAQLVVHRDRPGTEANGRIMEKLVRYVRAYDPEHIDYSGFPRVLFVVDHPEGERQAHERVKEMQRWIRQSRA